MAYDAVDWVVTVVDNGEVMQVNVVQWNLRMKRGYCKKFDGSEVLLPVYARNGDEYRLGLRDVLIEPLSSEDLDRYFCEPCFCERDLNVRATHHSLREIHLLVPTSEKETMLCAECAAALVAESEPIAS